MAERKGRQGPVAQRNELLAAAFDTLSLGVLLSVQRSGKRRVAYASRQLGVLLDMDVGTLVGKDEKQFWDQLLARLGNAAPVREDLERINSSEVEVRTDILHLVKPQSMVLERATSPVAGADGAYQGRVWTFRNISREVKLKEELQRRRKTEFCFRSLSAFLFEASLNAGSLEEICRIACTGLDVASVLFVPLALADLSPAQYAANRDLLVASGDEVVLRTFVARAMRRLEPGTTTLLEVGDLEPATRDALQARRIKRLFLVPVSFDDEIFGALLLEEVNDDRAWLREDYRCVESVARAMGLWLYKERGERRLLEAREEAEAAARVRTDFIALLSHELRTPLNPLIGFTQLLEEQQEGMSEEARDMVSRIADGATRLRELVEDLLTLTRLDSRLDGWRKYHCDPRSIVEDSCNWARRTLRDKTLDIELESDSDLGVIEADGAALRRALNALLSNAIRFSPEGGTIRVVTRADASHLRIQIVDGGPGVAEESKRKIFEPFVQGEPVLTRRHGGAGIGLTLVRRVAESHAGRVWVEDGEEGGSIFNLEFPRATLECDE